MPKGKKSKPNHAFTQIPIETFHRILSNLNLRELATVSEVSKWMHFIIAHLKIDYQLLTIKKSRRSVICKEVVSTLQTSAYCHLRFKLNNKPRRKKEMLEVIKRVRRENDRGNSSEIYKEAMKAMVGIFTATCSPTVGGALLDRLVNVKQYMHGLSGYDIGYFLTVSTLSAFCAWLLKVMCDEVNASYGDIQFIDEDIQLIDEESAAFKLPAY